MVVLLNDEDLRVITDKYHLIDATEIPLLIRLLWDIRHFQKDLNKLPVDKVQFLIERSRELDDAIAELIISLTKAGR